MFNDKSALISGSMPIEKFKEFVECGICKGILINPVQCQKCKHHFCKTCAESSLSNSQNCPFSCSPFTFVESKLMKEILSNVKMKCKNNCGVDIEYKDFEEHYNFNCEKANYQEKYEFEDQKRENEKTKIEELNKAITEKINQLKPEGVPDYDADKISKLFVSKYHLHPLEKDIYRRGIMCNVCLKLQERNAEKYICEKCRFCYCLECKDEELREIKK